MGPRIDGPFQEGSEPPLLFVLGDDDALRDSLGELLSDAGYRVESHRRDRDALLRIDGGILPDLIVLDPTTRGFDVGRFRAEQRKRPCLLDIPLVAITDSSERAMIEADSYVRKPIDVERARATIERLIVTRQRARLEEHSREIERLRALGSLVAGVAHEINNPLTYVCGNLDVAMRECRRLTSDAAAEAALRRMDAALTSARLGAERITNVVGALSRFSRTESEEPEAIDLHAALEGAITLASTTLRSRAKLTRDFGDLPLVLGSEARLTQVFLNLLVNAAQAIPEEDDGDHEVCVVTGRDDEIVFVEVSDTGMGIPPEIAKRVFDPFFTTKPPGGGTGLGLSISREIVSAHGGRISARPGVSRGTTFRVELPTMRPSRRDSTSRMRALSSGHDAPAFQKTLHIVVVDDEPLVGSVIAAALADHEVSVHSNPREALARLAKDDAAIDVILCDAYMRSLDGKSLFDALVRHRPELASRVLFMTASTDAEEVRRLEARTGKPILRKPFSIASLHRQIEDIVVTRSAASA